MKTANLQNIRTPFNKKWLLNTSGDASAKGWGLGGACGGIAT